jgi:hypothetical protein
VGRSAFNVSGDRKTRYVCDRHDLGAFAALCLANSKTPFFAGTKLPSMNASRISMPPRSYRSSTSSMAMRLKTPSSTHCWNRRWHVWYGGYRAGRSFHGAPVRSIHKTRPLHNPVKNHRLDDFYTKRRCLFEKLSPKNRSNIL